MEGGKLKHRIQIQSRDVSSRLTDGGINESWTTDATVWGAIEPLSGRELWEAQQTEARAQVRVRLRYHPTVDVTERMRLRYITVSGETTTVNATYNIVHVGNVDTRNRELIVLAVKEDD